MAAPERHVRTGGDLAILFRCYSYLRPFALQVVIAAILLLGITALTVAVPQLVRYIVDEGIAHHDVSLLARLVLGLLGLVLIKGVFTFVQGRLVENASQGVAYSVRRDIHEKLTGLSFSFHDQTESGQLLSRAVQDVERIRFLTGRATMRLVQGALLLIGTAVLLVMMSPRLALFALLTIPILLHRGYVFGRKVRPVSYKVQQQLAVLTSRLEQNLRGARIVKAFAQEEGETQRFDAENRRWFDLSLEQAKLRAIHGPLMPLIANLSTVLIIWLGGVSIINGRLTFGELLAFTTYMAQLAHPIRAMGMIAPIIGIAISAGERVFEIIDAESEVEESPDAVELEDVAGHVVFDHVWFSYGTRVNVLRDINLEANPGNVVALLGATGSGKSSLINLIPRFYDVSRGGITVDGTDIRDVTLTSLRGQIGIVLQESMLFAKSVRENIRFGRPDATDEDVIEAAKAAQAHEFITEMPKSYDTLVGERGITLSGGQKQRVAIARALLKDPRILLLDDATSSVDTETEHLIQLALERLMLGRTSFVIAQRLSTVRMADQILVLERGKISGRGTHDELMKTSKLYRTIYEKQLRPQEVEQLKKEEQR
jgi:ATP-binding cassette subfamily B protein